MQIGTASERHWQGTAPSSTTSTEEPLVLTQTSLCQSIGIRTPRTCSHCAAEPPCKKETLTTRKRSRLLSRIVPLLTATCVNLIALGIILPVLPFYVTKFGAGPEVAVLIFSMFLLCFWDSSLVFLHFFDFLNGLGHYHFSS